MVVIIPLAGLGTRFQKVGFKDPKPFIKINNKFMILHVVENISIPGAKYVFIAQKEHLAQYGAELIEQLKKSIVKDFEIIGLDGVTEGAACTVLTAEKFINSNEELLIVNSDQLLEPNDICNAVKYFEKQKSDGGIICFFNQGTQWSYVGLNEKGHIYRVAEKNPISDHATTGIYYFSEGKIFINATKEMVSKNDRVKNEFYLAPVFNYILIDNKVILPYFVNSFRSLGTPEDLERYILE